MEPNVTGARNVVADFIACVAKQTEACDHSSSCSGDESGCNAAIPNVKCASKEGANSAWRHTQLHTGVIARGKDFAVRHPAGLGATKVSGVFGDV